MANKRIDNVLFENVKPIFQTNFAGRETDVNSKGSRNFNIEIPDMEFAKQLQADGWNVKIGKTNRDGEEYPPFMKINVGYPEDYPQLWPKIMREQNGNQVYLDADTVGELDQDDMDDRIQNIRFLEISGRYNTVGGVEYVTAYARKMRVEVAPDIFCD